MPEQPGEHDVQPLSVCIAMCRRRRLLAGKVIHAIVDGFGSSLNEGDGCKQNYLRKQ
ncbi:MAG TPA: hypothetical protein VFA41_19830 [Ktedonobacteraceae bacterium]|nr:hypothetical protein [Ktedonobacteraceae bacterium]